MIERSLALFLGILVGYIGYVFSQKKHVKENFLPSMTYKVDRVAAPNQDFAHKGEFWSVPGTFQALVEPRSASMQYGSQIQYNLPPEGVLAYRSDTPFANDGLLTGDGDMVQPVTYDRFMFSNKKSRLRSHGDPIRGDLPIIPHNSDWFRPSVQPHIDLKEGAMQVMGGYDNETNNQLSQLMAVSAGNALQTFGGTNFSGDDGMSAQMGAFMRSPETPSRNVRFANNSSGNTRTSLSAFMSAAPQGSNLAQGFAATGMVPSFADNASNFALPTLRNGEPAVQAFSIQGMVPQNLVSIQRSGDVNVMRG